MFSLKCGIIVGCCIPQGDWYRNGELLQRNSSTLAVRNATFEDEGTYQYVNNGLSRSFLVAVYELVITIMVDSNQKDINGRAGCNYERTCCADDTRVTLNWFGSGGGPPLVSSSNIIVTSNQTGERKCTTIAFRPATVGSQEYTCFGTSGNRFVSLNFGIAIPAGTKPRSIQVYGDAQKNITGWNVGEPVTVSCTVDSCITGTYRIRFAFPNDTEISNRFFDTMMHTDTTTIILGQNNSGLYKCEVAAFNGTVLDTATFEFVGTKPRSIQVYGDAQKNIPGNVPVVPVSVAVVVVIIVAIVVSFTTATIIVIRYKHSKLTTNPTQSDSPQEPPSSSPSNLTVYRKKDVKMFDKIGRGSFWKVYRGKLLDSCCAIKRLRGVKKGGDHEGLVSKVLRELDMWSSLNHPNIISLYGIYHEDDINIPLLIVELMDRNLTDQLNSTFDPTHRKSLFPLKTKLSILSQVAGALDYLHCIERVIHGDLTSNNILLKENSPGSFTSKLTDFGMSRALNEQDNVMSTVQGTYSYMPPEVQNAGETTTKVDIYSFGVLCVHVLSHRFPKPMHACNVDDLGAHVVVSEFSRYRPYLMELDDDEKLLEPLIEECLQYEPEDRLRSEEVIGQLNSIEGRLSLKETGPSNPSHQPSVIHQQFSGPIVSGCTISGSVMNVGSFTNRNMQSLPVVDTAPLPAPLEVIPEVSFGGNIPNTSTSLTAPSEVNPA